jgi:hypothetical protein
MAFSAMNGKKTASVARSFDDKRVLFYIEWMVNETDSTSHL